MILSFVFLALAIASYSISQLAQHGKIKWLSNEIGFWGIKSDLRKYKNVATTPDLLFFPEKAPDNIYYRFFKIKYKERWPTSASFTVNFTDGYHLMQFFFFLFLSISVAFAIGFTWWLALGIWIGIHAVHFTTYKILSK